MAVWWHTDLKYFTDLTIQNAKFLINVYVDHISKEEHCSSPLIITGACLGIYFHATKEMCEGQTQLPSFLTLSILTFYFGLHGSAKVEKSMQWKQVIWIKFKWKDGLNYLSLEGFSFSQFMKETKHASDLRFQEKEDCTNLEKSDKISYHSTLNRGKWRMRWSHRPSEMAATRTCIAVGG